MNTFLFSGWLARSRKQNHAPFPAMPATFFPPPPSPDRLQDSQDAKSLAKHTPFSATYLTLKSIKQPLIKLPHPSQIILPRPIHITVQTEHILEARFDDPSHFSCPNAPPTPDLSPSSSLSPASDLGADIDSKADVQGLFVEREGRDHVGDADVEGVCVLVGSVRGSGGGSGIVDVVLEAREEGGDVFVFVGAGVEGNVVVGLLWVGGGGVDGLGDGDVFEGGGVEEVGRVVVVVVAGYEGVVIGGDGGDVVGGEGESEVEVLRGIDGVVEHGVEVCCVLERILVWCGGFFLWVLTWGKVYCFRVGFCDRGGGISGERDGEAFGLFGVLGEFLGEGEGLCFDGIGGVCAGLIWRLVLNWFLVNHRDIQNVVAHNSLRSWTRNRQGIAFCIFFRTVSRRSALGNGFRTLCVENACRSALSLRTFHSDGGQISVKDSLGPELEGGQRRKGEAAGYTTYNLDLNLIQSFVKFQVGSGDDLGNGCFGHANLPGIMGSGSAKVFARLFELQKSARELLGEMGRSTTTASVLSSESVVCFVVSVSAIESILTSVDWGAGAGKVFTMWSRRHGDQYSSLTVNCSHLWEK